MRVQHWELNGTIRFKNNYGSECTTINVVISNCIDSSVTYLGSLQSVTGKTSYNNTLYDRSLKLNVEENKDSEIEVNFKNTKGSNFVNAKDANLYIEDLTNCLASSHIRNSGNVSKVTINPICSGMICLNWTDYSGARQSRLIEVYAQKGEIAPVYTDIVQIVEEKSNDDYDNGDQEATDNQGEQYYQAPIIKPEVDIENVTFDGTKRTFNVVLDKSDTKKWVIMKESEYVSSEHFSNKYHYNTVPGKKLTGDSVTIDALDYEDGNYIFIAIGITGYTFSWMAIPISLGPSSCYEQPEIICNTESVEDGSCINYNFQINNCTNARYCIIPREVKENGELSEFKMPAKDWNSFISNGTINVYNASIPNSFTVPVSANNLKKSGYYDVVVFAMNGSDKVVAYKNEGPVFVNTPPKIEIEENTQKRQCNYKEYNVKTTESNENDKITESFYYISRKENKSDYTQPTISEIKSKGKKIENNGIIKLSDSGIYDITIYAKDSNNAESIKYIDNIVVSNLPEIKYTIEGEDDNSTFSTKKRDKQIVNLTVNDKDTNDSLSVKYFISEDYIENIDINTFQEEKYNVKELMTNVPSGEKGKIDVTSEKGESTQYVYMMITDKYGVSSIKTTGALNIDNSDFKLQYVYTDEKENYVIGDEFNVYLQFNHPVKEQNIYPNVALQIDDKTITQTSVNKEGDNLLKYTFKITEEVPTGYINNISLKYDNDTKFVDDYEKHNEFNKALDEYLEINKQIKQIKPYINTIIPTVDKVTINVETEDDRCIDKDDTKIVGKYKKVTITVWYSEPVSNTKPILNVNFGNKVSQNLLLEKIDENIDENTTEEERNKASYDLTNWLKEQEKSNYSGSIYVNVIPTKELKAINGNKVRYNESLEQKYILNGTELTNQTISIDNSIYPIVATNLGQIINSKNNINEGTSIKYFAEFNKPEDYEDLSEIDEISFKVYYNKDNPVVTDKSENKVAANSEGASDDSSYQKMATYTLSKDQLPIDVNYDKEGKFKTICYKKDKMGNDVEMVNDIDVTMLVSLAKGVCQYRVPDKEKVYNYLALPSEQRKLDIYLLADEEINMDDYHVYASANQFEENEASYIEDVEISGFVLKKYTIDADSSGIYKVTVKNLNDEPILEDYLKIYNVFTPGDTNYDGILNAFDITNILRYIARFENNSEYAKYLKYTGDVDGNGEVDVNDVIFLSRFITEDPEMIINNDGYIDKK